MINTRFRELIEHLLAAKVEFILVGGAAARALGSPRVTQDLDVVYRRSPENLDRLVEALVPLRPYPRGAPQGLPFRWDRRTLEFGLNFTLVTDFGYIDVLGEVTGGGYDDLLPNTELIEAFGTRCRCVDLDTLIRLKRAAGRPKDFEAIAELELMRDEPDDDAPEPT